MDSGNQLSRNDIAGGNSLYCFDVEPNFSDEGHYLNLLKQGTCSLEAVFKKPLKKATACVMYAEYPCYFEINLESVLTQKILNHADGMFTTPPSQIFYCYSVYQDLYNDMKREISNIHFHQGLPSMETLT